MATYAKRVVYKVGDRKPDFTMTVFQAETNAVRVLTGATTPLFFLYNVETEEYKLEDDASGVTISDAAGGVLQKLWQAADLDTLGSYAAWFSYEIGAGKVETTTAVELIIKNPWEAFG